MTVIRPNSISGVTSITAQVSDITIFGASSGFANITAGNISAAGTITYEDVTNIDSVGVVTARTGVKIGPSAGVAGTFFADGSYVTAGIITATTFHGSGANLTSLPAQATIANNADNRVITGGSGVNLNGESGLTYNGTRLDVTTGDLQVIGGEGGNAELRIVADQGDDGADYWRFQSAASGNNLNIATYASGAWVDKVSIDSSGRVGVNQATFATSDTMFSVSEISGHCEIGIISKNDSAVVINMGDTDSYNQGRIKYNNSDNSLTFRTVGSDRLSIASDGSLTVSSTTDGALNLTTTDSRGSFIRFQESGTSKCFVGSGQGLSLGTANDLGLRATTHIRMRSGAEEHAMLTDEGFFAAKGMAGNWVSNQSPASTLSHQFNNTGVSKWVCQFQQQHHAGFGVQILGNSTANSEAFVIYANSNNTTRFRVLWDGSVGSANNSYGGISDIKLKENIVDANSQWNDIKAVKVRNFNFKDTPDTKMLGVVAQEIETISPGLISEIVDKDPNTNESLGTTTKEVKYSILYMKAIKALQEAITRIETLEQDNIALRARVTNLEGN